MFKVDRSGEKVKILNLAGKVLLELDRDVIIVFGDGSAATVSEAPDVALVAHLAQKKLIP